MTDPYLGEIRMFGGDFAPEGWVLCDGQELLLSTYPELGALLGSTYGTASAPGHFKVPDLRGRVVVGVGQGTGLSNYEMGRVGGSEKVTIGTAEMPPHRHRPRAAKSAADKEATENVWGASTAKAFIRNPPGRLAPIREDAIIAAGGGEAHSNVMPFTAISFIISHAGQKALL